MFSNGAVNGRTLRAYRLTGEFNETAVNWGNQPGSNGTFATSPSGTGWRTWNVTGAAAGGVRRRPAVRLPDPRRLGEPGQQRAAVPQPGEGDRAPRARAAVRRRPRTADDHHDHDDHSTTTAADDHHDDNGAADVRRRTIVHDYDHDDDHDDDGAPTTTHHHHDDHAAGVHHVDGDGRVERRHVAAAVVAWQQLRH